MLYLNKLLSKIEENSVLFRAQDIISILGLSSSQIKDLKKYALENSYIEQEYLPSDIKNRKYYKFGNNKTEQAAKAYHEYIRQNSKK